MADFQNIINNQTSDQPVQNQIDQASEQPVGNDRGNTADAFNTIMLDLLKESKGIDNTQLLRKRRELRRGVLDTTQQPTEEGLRTLSPSQQSALRSSSARALEPELDKIDTDIAKSQKLSDSFFKRLEIAQNLGEDISKKMVASDEELDSFKQLIEGGQMSIKEVAGLTNESTLHKLLQNIDPNVIPKDGGKRRTQLTTIGGNRVLVDLDTSEIIKSYGPTQNAIEEQENPGKYSELDLRKLRNAGIDPTDITSADRFLFDKEIEKDLTDTEIEDIAKKMSDNIGGDKKFKNIKSLLDFLDKGRINKKGLTLILREEQKEKIKQVVTQSKEGLFDKLLKKGGKAVKDVKNILK